ncbi:hypothetical protein HF072_04590 [Bacillus sp. RO3]|nr:hypothetical protein [Bacillus sp. RO3]
MKFAIGDILVLEGERAILDIKEQAELLITLFGMIATVGAAIAAMITASVAKRSADLSSKQLEEMKQQRYDMNRPDIYITSQLIYLKYNPSTGYGNFIENETLPELIISNVGQGHAKNINIRWELDITKHIQFIRTFSFGGSKVHKYLEESELHTENGVTFIKDDMKTYTPVYLKGKEYSLKIPFSYLEILSLLMHLFQEGLLDSSVIPSLELEMDFNDVYNNRNRKRFVISPRIANQTSCTSDGRLSDYKIQINLVVNEQ